MSISSTTGFPPLQGGESGFPSDARNINSNQQLHAALEGWFRAQHIQREFADDVYARTVNGYLSVEGAIKEVKEAWESNPTPLAPDTSANSTTPKGSPTIQPQTTVQNATFDDDVIMEDREPVSHEKTVFTSDAKASEEATARALEAVRVRMEAVERHSARLATEAKRQRDEKEEKKRREDEAAQALQRQLEANPQYQEMLRRVHKAERSIATSVSELEANPVPNASNRRKKATTAALNLGKEMLTANTESWKVGRFPPPEAGEHVGNVGNRSVSNRETDFVPQPTMNMTFGTMDGSSFGNSGLRPVSKVQYLDYKKGTDVNAWLDGFAMACDLAGIPPTGRQQHLEQRLLPPHRMATRVHSLYATNIDPSDWVTIRTSVEAVVNGATSETIADKRRKEFQEFRTWTNAEEIGEWMLDLAGKFQNWVKAEKYDDKLIASHLASTLLEKLKEKLPPALKVAVTRNMKRGYAACRSAIFELYEEERTKGTQGIAPKMGVKAPIWAHDGEPTESLKKKQKTIEEQPIKKDKPVGLCFFKDACRNRGTTCKRAHPSDTCRVHPTQTHTNTECWSQGMKKEPVA